MARRRPEEWTEFEKEPPEANRPVVVAQLDGTCTVARLVYYPGDGRRGTAGWLWDVPGGDACDLEDLRNPVTHWLPLPALPPGRKRVPGWRPSGASLTARQQ